MEPKPFYIVAKAIAANKSLSATAKLLLAILNDHRNKDTGQCNPTRKTLARELGRSEATIKRALAELRGAELLTSHKGQRGNTYDPWQPKSCRVIIDPAEKILPGHKRPGAPGQNEPADPLVSLLTELDPLNYKEGKSAPSLYREPDPPPTVAGGTGALFPLFWQCFVNAGVALNGRDETAARRIFERYPAAEQERIGKWVIEQLQTAWRSPEYTPTPLNALRSEGWRRQAAPRIVPKPPTREEEFSRLLREHRARRGPV